VESVRFWTRLTALAGFLPGGAVLVETQVGFHARDPVNWLAVAGTCLSALLLVTVSQARFSRLHRVTLIIASIYFCLAAEAASHISETYFGAVTYWSDGELFALSAGWAVLGVLLAVLSVSFDARSALAARRAYSFPAWVAVLCGGTVLVGPSFPGGALFFALLGVCLLASRERKKTIVALGDAGRRRSMPVLAGLGWVLIGLSVIALYATGTDAWSKVTASEAKYFAQEEQSAKKAFKEFNSELGSLLASPTVKTYTNDRYNFSINYESPILLFKKSLTLPVGSDSSGSAVVSPGSDRTMFTVAITDNHSDPHVLLFVMVPDRVPQWADVAGATRPAVVSVLPKVAGSLRRMLAARFSQGAVPTTTITTRTGLFHGLPSIVIKAELLPSGNERSVTIRYIFTRGHLYKLVWDVTKDAETREVAALLRAADSFRAEW